jgi:tetratricopeptide (TPR) repeat protein
MPESYSARYFLANAYLYQQKHAESVPVLEAAIALKGVRVDRAEAQLAELLACAPDESLRNGQRALQLAQKALKSTPQPALIHYAALISAQLESGQFEAAAVTYANAKRKLKADDQAKLADLSSAITEKKPHRWPTKKVSE